MIHKHKILRTICKLTRTAMSIYEHIKAYPPYIDRCKLCTIHLHGTACMTGKGKAVRREISRNVISWWQAFS